MASFSSHAALKSWMELNDQFVRSIAAAHRLRFLSDAIRNEGGMFNPSAGESLLRYLRGRTFLSPCLIFSPTSVATTEYVLAYTRAGSTTEPQIVFGYIRALAEGVRDTNWLGFDVKKSGSQMPQNPTLQPHFIKPLLLYLVGTKPEQDQVHIDYASSLGITVVALFSLDGLRRYVEANQDELYRIAATHRIRFIMQNVRVEHGVLTLSAGEDTIKYIRSQGFAAPVLVLASSTIANTRFVSLYGRAGSTADGRIVRGFVEALAQGVRDVEWVGFDSRK
ncbi:hypothetical protein FB45DRAFT_928164 [Roridomyces roridus]|uniref:Uncharacterized protein n=1 Tax=Roridomyces roridus TaxID=1738132 RepID=A0AAD7FHN8_9AGAR|nr:hypothetical protein FB45DRAFT_928164 [Roridomyces roridus]